MTGEDGSTDWGVFGSRYWNAAPVVLPGRHDETVVDADRAYDAVVAASAPFRAGTRFRALPDVRFFTAAGKIGAPGDSLPGHDDPTVDHYVKRLGDGGVLLSVEQPLVLDFPLWSQVRDLIGPLWRKVGFPVLPVTAELTIGSDFSRGDGLTGEPTHAVLTWVLWGSMEVRLWRGGPDAPGVDRPERTLRAGTGDLVYRPARYRHAEVYDERCLALHLRVPVDRRLPVAAVTGLLADLLQDRRDTGGEVPYLAFPPPPGPDGSVPEMMPLAAAGAALLGAADDPELDRVLRVRWARRVSACGLEPAPGPREPAALTGDQRVRATADIVRMPDEPGSTIWAVNGHAFTVRGASVDHVPQLLKSPVTVGELTGESGSGVLALLHRLYALRGIEVVGDAC